MPPQLRSAMYDAVPDGCRRRGAAIVKKFSDADDRIPLAGDVTPLGGQCISVGVFSMEFGTLIADRLSLAGDEPFDL